MIITYNQAREIFPSLKNDGKKIIFKSGCFDIFHIGHLETLKEAKSHADILVVGIGSDINIRKFKGEDRPIFNEQQRSEVIDSVKYTDYTIIMDETITNDVWIDHEELVSIINPDFYFLIKNDKMMKYKIEFAQKYNMKIILQNDFIQNHQEIMSSTTILNILKN